MSLWCILFFLPRTGCAGWGSPITVRRRAGHCILAASSSLPRLCGYTTAALPLSRYALARLASRLKTERRGGGRLVSAHGKDGDGRALMTYCRGVFYVLEYQARWRTGGQQTAPLLKPGTFCALQPSVCCSVNVGANGIAMCADGEQPIHYALIMRRVCHHCRRFREDEPGITK